MTQHSCHYCFIHSFISLFLPTVSLEHLLERLVVSDDAVVNHEEFVGRIGSVRVAVVRRGRTVGGPARVRDATVVLEVHVTVHVLLVLNLFCFFWFTIFVVA